MQELTSTALAHQTRKIRQRLLAGEQFSLVHRGEVWAHLVPVATAMGERPGTARDGQGLVSAFDRLGKRWRRGSDAVSVMRSEEQS
jgi:antitoxin (DNA-binding transcriptional repressor) of toxin-antitoxin stability system